VKWGPERPWSGLWTRHLSEGDRNTVPHLLISRQILYWKFYRCLAVHRHRRTVVFVFDSTLLSPASDKTVGLPCSRTNKRGHDCQQ